MIGGVGVGKVVVLASNSPRIKSSSRQIVLASHYAPNIHLSQFPHAHLFQTPICPNCSFSPIAQSPFALLLVFPGAHFPLKLTCPNAHQSQNTHLLQSAHLSQLLICPGAHFFWCPFALNAHFPPMLTSPNVHYWSQGAHYAPKYPFAANTSLLWCSCFLVPIFPKCPFARNACLSLCPSTSKVLVCPIKCPKYPFAPMTSCPYNCTRFSWCPFSQVPICPK